MTTSQARLGSRLDPGQLKINYPTNVRRRDTGIHRALSQDRRWDAGISSMTMSPRRVMPDPSLEEVAADVYAYVQPDGSWCLNNAGVVRGGGATVVVDTAATASRARRLRQAVTSLGGSTVTIVNTHHHGDHVFGNSVFGPDTTIVAHQLARSEMIASGLALQELWPEVEWGEIELTLPTVTFSRQATLHIGELEMQLVHVGPAHTTNDVVVWLPGRDVLFAGDVVFNGAAPFCLMGSVSGSLAAISRLRELGAGTIVPGHGPVGGGDLLGWTADYLTWVQRVAADGVDAGLSPLEAAREAGPGPFPGLLDSERIIGNLVRAYSELSGEEPGTALDVPAAFQLMVEYHGGMPRCFA